LNIGEANYGRIHLALDKGKSKDIKTDIAEKAMKEGFLVMGLKEKPHIFRS